MTRAAGVVVSIEQARIELDSITPKIRRAKAHLDRLYERRRQLFCVLLDGGDSQASIARRAKITPMAVVFSAEKARSA